MRKLFKTILSFSILIVGCAHQSEKSVVNPYAKVDFKEERLQSLSDTVMSQKKKIGQLESKVIWLEAELAKKEKLEAAKTPTSPLKEPTYEELTETTSISDAPAIADSTHEVMHWYFEGLNFWKNKKFDSAVSAFETFLREEPTHLYSDRALFFVIDSYFKDKEYDLALDKSNQFEKIYAHSLRLPDVIYRKGLILSELKQPLAAAGVLRRLMEKYPKEELSKKAAEKIASLHKELK
jgi:TolA-binding protein